MADFSFKFLEAQLFFICGRRVVLDAHLAELYGVSTRTLNQAVKRNKDRFPEDFAFRLSPRDAKRLKSQIVISSRGGRKHRPLVFTEQGAALVPGILKSDKAVQASIGMARTLVKTEEALIDREELLLRIKNIIINALE